MMINNLGNATSADDFIAQSGSVATALRVNAATDNVETNTGRVKKYSIISSPLTLTTQHNIVEVDDGSTITLPTAVGVTGQEYNIIRSGTSNVLISTTGAETISGDSELTLTSQWDSVVLYSNGTNWVRGS